MIDDYKYDKLSHALAMAMKKSEHSDKTKYYYVFYDYEGSTAYNLISRLTEHDKDILMSLVMYAVEQEKH